MMGIRIEYLQAVQAELGHKTQSELLQHIAFCWKKQDDQKTQIKSLRDDLRADTRPRRYG